MDYAETQKTHKTKINRVSVYSSHMLINVREYRREKEGGGLIRNEQWRNKGNIVNNTENGEKSTQKKQKTLHNSRTSVYSSHMVIDVAEYRRERKRGN